MQYFQMILDFMNNILNVFSKENDDMIKDSLNELKKSIEAHYKIKFNFDDKYFYYPLFKDSGYYSDLTFN